MPLKEEGYIAEPATKKEPAAELYLGVKKLGRLEGVLGVPASRRKAGFRQCFWAKLDGVRAGFASANPNDLIDGGNEDFTVSNFAGLSRSGNGVNTRLDGVFIHHQL